MLESTDIGPKASASELEKVERLTEAAIVAGATPLLRGGRPETPPVEGGHWLLPTVLGNVTPDMAIMRDEIFGPVVPVMRVSSFDEALQVANDSNYGLSAYLFTDDFSRIMQAVRDVRFGEIYINRIGPEALHVTLHPRGEPLEEPGEGLAVTPLRHRRQPVGQLLRRHDPCRHLFVWPDGGLSHVNPLRLA
jgi:acyl-CoA reductase-like NAD-dependent aldehyde dehydrogenase